MTTVGAVTILIMALSLIAGVTSPSQLRESCHEVPSPPPSHCTYPRSLAWRSGPTIEVCTSGLSSITLQIVSLLGATRVDVATSLSPSRSCTCPVPLCVADHGSVL